MTMEILSVQFARIYVGNALKTNLSAQVVQHQILDNYQDRRVIVQQDCCHQI